MTRSVVQKKPKSRLEETAYWECTVNLRKLLHGSRLKSRSAKAIKKLQQFAQKFTSVEDVRVDVALNKFIWSRGIKNPPFRVRVRMERCRNDDKESIHKMYTILYHIPATKETLKEPTVKTLV